MLQRIGGGMILAAFVLPALRVPRPLLNVRLYRKPTFSSASVAMPLSGRLTERLGVGPIALAIVPCIILTRAERAARRARAAGGPPADAMAEAVAA